MGDAGVVFLGIVSTACPADIAIKHIERAAIDRPRRSAAAVAEAGPAVGQSSAGEPARSAAGQHCAADQKQDAAGPESGIDQAIAALTLFCLPPSGKSAA